MLNIEFFCRFPHGEKPHANQIGQQNNSENSSNGYHFKYMAVMQPFFLCKYITQICAGDSSNDEQKSYNVGAHVPIQQT